MAFTSLVGTEKMEGVRTILNNNFNLALEKPAETDAGILFYKDGVVSIAVANTDYIVPDKENNTTTINILSATNIEAAEADIEDLAATKASLGETTITGVTSLTNKLNGANASFSGLVEAATLQPMQTNINKGAVSFVDASLNGNIGTFNLTIGDVGFSVDKTIFTVGGTLKTSTLEAQTGTLTNLTAETLKLGDNKIIFQDSNFTFNAPAMVNSTIKANRTLSLDNEPQYRPITLGTAVPTSLPKGQIFIVM